MLNTDFFKKPMDYSRLCFEIEKLSKFKNIVEVFSIGKTWENRDILCMKLGKGKINVIYVGAHHALEWGTSSVLVNFALEFIEAIQKKNKFYGYDCNLILNKVTFYIIPMLNPDGVNLVINGLSTSNSHYQRILNYNNNSLDFGKWQANIRGVDLNHNYNAGFEISKRIQQEQNITMPCATKYGGENFESEKETKTLCKFTRHIKPSIVIALHSQGKEIYYEFNDNTSVQSKNIAIILAKLTGYKLVKTTGLASYGGYKDWFIESLNGIGFTIEIGEGTNPLDFNQLIDAYKEVREALICAPLLIKQ